LARIDHGGRNADFAVAAGAGVVIVTAANGSYAEAGVEAILPEGYAGEPGLDLRTVHYLDGIHLAEIRFRQPRPAASHANFRRGRSGMVDRNHSAQTMRFRQH